jgi:histidine ammonia-lyase
MQPLVIDRVPLTPADVTDVALRRRPVALGPAAQERLKRGRDLIDHFLREDIPVYGLTRGLGGRAVTRVADGERDEMSTVMLRARACGGGPRFPVPAVRAFLLARLASMCQGRAGVRPLIAARLVEFLNKGLHPVVHEVGSVGASDLALLAELGIAVMGEGLAEFQGEVLPAAEALRRAGLEPIRLKEKEGLGLCSANSVSAGLGALALTEARRLLRLAEATCVLSFEAFRANLSPIDPRIVAARPAPGQRAAAEALHGFIAGSGLTGKGAARRIQDPVSIRCASHIFGAFHSALDFAEPHVAVEINGAGDNPAVLWEDAEIVSTGNFQTPGLAQAFDLLCISMSQVGSIAAQRTGRMMGKRFTDLPDYLSARAEGTVRIGLALVGHNARCQAKELHLLATPASVDDASGYDVEDHEPMTPVAVRKFWRALPFWRSIIASELIVAAEALDQRNPERPAPVAVALRDAVRQVVARLDDDRPLSEDLERVVALVEGETLSALVG